MLAAFIGVPNMTVAGVITGRVIFAGTVPPPTKLEVTADQYVCGAEKDAGDLLLSARREIANAVVWLDNPPAGGAAPVTPKVVTIDQKACPSPSKSDPESVSCPSRPARINRRLCWIR